MNPRDGRRRARQGRKHSGSLSLRKKMEGDDDEKSLGERRRKRKSLTFGIHMSGAADHACRLVPLPLR